MQSLLNPLKRASRLCISHDFLPSTTPSFCSQQLNFVRWRKGRKPSYIGVAKTKRFLPRQKIELPEEEDREIRRLTNQYRTYLRSLW